MTRGTLKWNIESAPHRTGRAVAAKEKVGAHDLNVGGIALNKGDINRI